MSYYGFRANYWTDWIGFYPNLRNAMVARDEIESKRQASLNWY